MSTSWRTLRSLRHAGPRTLMATYRAGAIARLVHKESPLARNEAVLNIKKISEGARRQSWRDWFNEDWRKIAMSLGFIATAVAAAASFNKDTNRSVEVINQKLSNSLAEVKMKRQSTQASRNYVARPELEAKILSVYDNTSLYDGTYYIIYGVHGAGKTLAVNHALGDKAGVVLVSVSENDSVDSIIAKIFKACGVVVDKAVRLDQINEELYAAMEKRNGHPMTVVFEVEETGSSSQNVLSLVKHTAKEFALHANVLIVLFDANSVLSFGDDNRQKFILVGEMTLGEAEQYVKKRAPGISPEDFNKFVDKCGTFPLLVGQFCTAVATGKNVDEHIAKVLDSARGDLEAFAHSPILIALKKTPGGVRSGTFIGVKHRGVMLSSPNDVAPAMKRANAIMYDIGTNEYKLFSKAHQSALETYNPPLI